jgi:hypothetical protein
MVASQNKALAAILDESSGSQNPKDEGDDEGSNDGNKLNN